MHRTHFITLLGNLWIYFRTGFSVYITLPLSALETLIIIWYLPAVKDSWVVQQIFRNNFVLFLIFAAIVGTPIAMGFGKFHWIKWAYRSEMDVNVRGNPYNYKLTPGYSKEALGPYYELTLSLLLKLTKEERLTFQDEKTVTALLEKFRVLNQGGKIGYTDANI